MVKILPVSERVWNVVDKHHIRKKFEKQLHLLSANSQHPGLHAELLEPRQHGIYSFRIDRKYRGLFVYHSDIHAVEIISVTVHYH